MRTQRAYNRLWFRNHCATGMDQEGTRVQPPTPEPALVGATHNSSSSDGERRRTIGPRDLLLRAAHLWFKDCVIRWRELNPTPKSRHGPPVGNRIFLGPRIIPLGFRGTRPPSRR